MSHRKRNRELGTGPEEVRGKRGEPWTLYGSGQMFQKVQGGFGGGLGSIAKKKKKKLFISGMAKL